MTEAAVSPSAYRGNSSIVILAMSIAMFVSMLPLAVAPGVLLMAREFGDITAQLVMTLPAVMMILGAAICGYLAERWGRRGTIVAALLVYAFGGALGFFATSLPLLVVSRVAAGLSAGVLMTTIYAAIGEYYGGNARERLLGFMTMASSISSVAMLGFMGIVVEKFGWRAPFLFYGVAILVVPFALAGLHKGLSAIQNTPLSWGPVIRNWPIYALLLAYGTAMFMLVIQGAFLLEEKGITAPSTVGRLLAVSSLVAGVAAAFYGLARRFLGFRQMFLLISLALGIGLPLAALAHGTGMFVVAAAIVGIAMGTTEATIASELLQRTPVPLHDRAMGLNVAALFLGQFLNPLVVAPLHGFGGAALAFHVVGIACLAGGALFFGSLIMRARFPAGEGA